MRAVRVMGIVNATPDSFSDGGRHLDPDAAIAHGCELAAEGASIIDVGGESTRPGAEPVAADEELRRTRPVVAGLAALGLTVSIDTSKASVAEAALDAGAEVVNDISALRGDPAMARLCAERGCTVVLMHMLGTPRTMQVDPRYEDVVAEVGGFLAGRVKAAIEAGIDPERIWVDPGIGFGKTLDHNLELLRRIDELAALGRPLLVGASRKEFIGRITGRGVDGRRGGDVAANVLAMAGGAEVLRVHDVGPLVAALEAAELLLGRRPWERAA
ncbi:MAG: dihydropteroate synthase [Solirubrobacterales bacterium]|nr:dihydropteroate synthase [Solirubrobacterales bacterium]